MAATYHPDLLAKIPENGWTPAYDAHDQVRDGAWVAELTGLMDLEGWPAGLRGGNFNVNQKAPPRRTPCQR